MRDKLTIVIPTKNRSSFVIRALKYYASVACPFPVLIGDSSEEGHSNTVKNFIKTEINGKIKVDHRTLGSVRSEPKGWQDDAILKHLMEEVQTPYTAFYADDDFAVVQKLGSAVDFLDANDDYSFVCGEALIFSLKSDEESRELLGTRKYHQRSISEDLPSERLLELARFYCVLEYGVSRTSEMRYRWQAVFESAMDNEMGELLNSALVAVQGKIKKMKNLFLVRQEHAQMTSRGKSQFDWITDPKFSGYWKKYLEIVGSALAKKEGIALDQSLSIIKRVFWAYISKILNEKWDGKYNTDGSYLRKFKKAVRKIPIARQFRDQVFSYFPWVMTLPALLRHSSRYHSDFKKIYEVIQKQQ